MSNNVINLKSFKKKKVSKKPVSDEEIQARTKNFQDLSNISMHKNVVKDIKESNDDDIPFIKTSIDAKVIASDLEYAYQRMFDSFDMYGAAVAEPMRVGTEDSWHWVSTVGAQILVALTENQLRNLLEGKMPRDGASLNEVNTAVKNKLDPIIEKFGPVETSPPELGFNFSVFVCNYSMIHDETLDKISVSISIVRTLNKRYPQDEIFELAEKDIRLLIDAASEMDKYVNKPKLSLVKK